MYSEYSSDCRYTTTTTSTASAQHTCSKLFSIRLLLPSPNKLLDRAPIAATSTPQLRLRLHTHVLYCTVQTVNVYNRLINFILVHKSSRIRLLHCCHCCWWCALYLCCPFRHLIKRKITIIAYEYVVEYGVYTGGLINAASPTSSLYHIDSKRPIQ
jgi:hypothetical protein